MMFQFVFSTRYPGFFTGFFLGILFDPEDGGCTFLRNELGLVTDFMSFHSKTVLFIITAVRFFFAVSSSEFIALNDCMMMISELVGTWKDTVIWAMNSN
jgi:hypothetical protein